MSAKAVSSGRSPHPGPARSVAMAGGKGPSRKSPSRLHRTVIEHGATGGGKVTHERVRKDAESYNGLRTEEQPSHMFGDNAAMMAHLKKTIAPAAGAEPDGDEIPADA